MIARNNFLATGDEYNFSEWDISRDGMIAILDAIFGKTSFKKVSYKQNFKKQFISILALHLSQGYTQKL